MKFTLGWLRDHLDTDAGVDAIAAKLTAIGHEVEGVENPAAQLAGFRIARVLSAASHPQADKLQVLSVDAGDGPLQVVCGAPNARAGLVGVFGAPGAVVPANGMELRVAAIRGVESNGMMCSSRELGLGDEHDGILDLPEDIAIGTDFATWAGLDDPVFDVAITPNRQDCMGVRGIARDLAAAGLGTLKPLDVPHVAGSYPCPVEIRTDDAEGCPAFYGRTIRGIRNGASLPWMARRLTAVGQRTISAVVDITNYLMLDLGRPSHAYDLAKLEGPVVARRANDGERMTALNGKEYALDFRMTVIADERQVHDIAGIMGGEHSGVTEATTDLLLEVAYFTPERIAVTGQALALTSDARTRFERGVDPAFLDDALAILTARIVDLCGGEVSEVVRAGVPPVANKRIAYDPGLCMRLGGVDVTRDEQRAILGRLGFVVDGAWNVAIPSWRRDVDGAADLVEEIVRIVGLDRVASVPLPRAEGVAKPTATPAQKLERRVRRTAAARGLDEAITWSFVSDPEAAAFGAGAWSLANPISDDLRVMRPSLLPGLLSAVARNMSRGAGSVALFEIGRRYLADDERLTAGVALAGERSARGWREGRAQPFDAFDAKAHALALLDAAGAPVDNLQVFAEAGAHYHPGQSATLRLGPKTVLAAFGALHPAVLQSFDLQAAIGCEVFLDAIPAKRGGDPMRAPFAPPALQPVRRDFAFLVPADLPADTLVRAVRGADKAAIVDARLFDLFTGTGVPEGAKSLAVEVVLQPVAKSFTDDELGAVTAKVVAATAKLGATLRG